MSLAGYVARRLLQMMPVVFGVTILVFFLIHLVPGDPAGRCSGVHATPQRGRSCCTRSGASTSRCPCSTGCSWSGSLHGDLGDSLFYRVSGAGG